MPHIENVAAMEDGTEILAVPRAVFLELIERDPRVTLALLHDTCAKLAMASHNQKALACQDVRTRLATFLVSYAMFDGAPRGATEVRICAPLTQDDMAAALGVTRRAVAQEIARWTKLGVLDREPVGAVLRVPAAAESRGNLHVGGRAVKTTIDARDREIIDTIAPVLRSYGQILVGLDVIGGMLTEINITSPTGVRHASKLDGTNVAAPILDCFERMAKTAKVR